MGLVESNKFDQNFHLKYISCTFRHITRITKGTAGIYLKTFGSNCKKRIILVSGPEHREPSTSCCLKRASVSPMC